MASHQNPQQIGNGYIHYHCDGRFEQTSATKHLPSISCIYCLCHFWNDKSFCILIITHGGNSFICFYQFWKNRWVLFKNGLVFPWSTLHPQISHINKTGPKHVLILQIVLLCILIQAKHLCLSFSLCTNLLYASYFVFPIDLFIAPFILLIIYY